MEKLTLHAIEEEWRRLQEAFKKDDGGDAALKERYDRLQKRVFGLRVVSVHTGEIYGIIGIVECGDALAFEVHRFSDGDVACVHASDLQMG